MTDITEELAKHIHHIVRQFALDKGVTAPSPWEKMREPAREHYRNEAKALICHLTKMGVVLAKAP